MTAHSSSTDRDPLERLADDYLARRRRGEAVSPSEYASRHPELADLILEAFPALEVMEGLKPGSEDGTASLEQGETASSIPRLERLGEYRILREIGHGGMGVVYEALQESLGRRVALKILPFHGRVDPVQIERFRLESRSAARLHHGNIVPVHGVGEDEGVYYYAMQYIQGHGLDVILADLKRLKDGVVDEKLWDVSGSVAVARSLLTGRFDTGRQSGADPSPVRTLADGHADRSGDAQPVAASSSVLSRSIEAGYYRTVARVGVQVAQALAHAHGQGVLHRDIKPSNLLLDVAGHVWVTDFGLAKLEGSEGPTQTGDILGTLRYMAPERFEGWSDRRGDVYGLGMTLYEMLTLRPAFDAATRARLIDHVIHDPPPPPRKLDGQIPRDLETIVLKAIAKEPAERYATAEGMATDLENYLSDRPITARRSTPFEQAWRWCRRNPAVAGFLGATVVAMLATVGVAVGAAYNAELKEALDKAVSARREAEGSNEREARTGYFNRIVLAEREWLANNVPRAEQLLDECMSRFGVADRRNWEWFYLKRLCRSERLQILAHENEISCLKYSPDGRYLVTASIDQSIKIWDANTGEAVRTLKGFDGTATRLAFSPDGHSIAAGGTSVDRSPRVVIWEIESRRSCLRLTEGLLSVLGLAFSPDGQSLATAGSAGVIQIWNALSGMLIRSFSDQQHEPITSIDFSPDGTRLAVANGTTNLSASTRTRGTIRIWNFATGHVLHTLVGHATSVSCVAYDPDGKRLVSAGFDGTIRIWSAADLQRVQILAGHNQRITAVTFSRDGARLASASEGGIIKIWDAVAGVELFTVRGHGGRVNSVAFSPDGASIASAGEDGIVRIWNAAPQESMAVPIGASWVTSVAYNCDGTLLVATGADGTVEIRDAPSGRLHTRLAGHKGAAWSAAFSPDGTLLATTGNGLGAGSGNGEIRIWDVKTGGERHTLGSQARRIWQVAFSPDGQQLAFCGGDIENGPGELKLWTFSKAQTQPIIEGSAKGIRCIAISRDGRTLASAGGEKVLTLWDVATLQPRLVCTGHTGSIQSIVFDPDDKTLATASEDKTVRIWDVATGATLSIFRGHTNGVSGLAFSPDGLRIASASVDQTIKVWDTITGQEILTLRGNRSPVLCVAFAADYTFLASGAMDGTLRLWDASPMAVRRPPRAGGMPWNPVR